MQTYLNNNEDTFGWFRRRVLLLAYQPALNPDAPVECRTLAKKLMMVKNFDAGKFLLRQSSDTAYTHGDRAFDGADATTGAKGAPSIFDRIREFVKQSSEHKMGLTVLFNVHSFDGTAKRHTLRGVVELKSRYAKHGYRTFLMLPGMSTTTYPEGLEEVKLHQLRSLRKKQWRAKQNDATSLDLGGGETIWVRADTPEPDQVIIGDDGSVVATDGSSMEGRVDPTEVTKTDVDAYVQNIHDANMVNPPSKQSIDTTDLPPVKGWTSSGYLSDDEDLVMRIATSSYAMNGHLTQSQAMHGEDYTLDQSFEIIKEDDTLRQKKLNATVDELWLLAGFMMTKPGQDCVREVIDLNKGGGIDQCCRSITKTHKRRRVPATIIVQETIVHIGVADRSHTRYEYNQAQRVDGAPMWTDEEKGFTWINRPTQGPGTLMESRAAVQVHDTAAPPTGNKTRTETIRVRTRFVVRYLEEAELSDISERIADKVESRWPIVSRSNTKDYSIQMYRKGKMNPRLIATYARGARTLYPFTNHESADLYLLRIEEGSSEIAPAGGALQSEQERLADLRARLITGLNAAVSR